jgi:hypothetical protein
MRQSHSAQSAVCVVMVEPSLEALRPTAMAVHLSEITALGSESTLVVHEIVPTEYTRVTHTNSNFAYIVKIFFHFGAKYEEANPSLVTCISHITTVSTVYVSLRVTHEPQRTRLSRANQCSTGPLTAVKAV